MNKYSNKKASTNVQTHNNTQGHSFHKGALEDNNTSINQSVLNQTYVSSSRSRILPVPQQQQPQQLSDTSRGKERRSKNQRNPQSMVPAMTSSHRASEEMNLSKQYLRQEKISQQEKSVVIQTDDETDDQCLNLNVVLQDSKCSSHQQQRSSASLTDKKVSFHHGRVLDQGSQMNIESRTQEQLDFNLTGFSTLNYGKPQSQNKSTIISQNADLVTPYTYRTEACPS